MDFIEQLIDYPINCASLIDETFFSSNLNQSICCGYPPGLSKINERVTHQEEEEK